MLDVPRNMLKEAIAIWLRHAYPTGEIPPAVQKRVALDETTPVSELLQNAPFERYDTEAPQRSTVYALRLGSTDYPHLKLEIRPFPSRHQFVFWVNTHDHFVTPDSRFRDADRWRDLVQRNRDLKQTIERAWAEADLPTHNAVLQEDLDQAMRSRTQSHSAP